MMNYGNFGWNGGMTFFGWNIIPILLIIVLVLGAVALWKYIHKK